MKEHWLVRKRSIRLLWFLFVSILGLTVAAGLFIESHAYFGVDGLPAFNAWYGFLTCIAMVLFAKLLGRVLQRKDDYYDRD